MCYALCFDASYLLGVVWNVYTLEYTCIHGNQYRTHRAIRTYVLCHTYVCTYAHLNVHRTTLVFLFVSDGVAVCLHAGLCRKPVEMEEFSLAWKDDNSDTFINGN